MIQKTDLNKCKSVALSFLYLDIDTSSQFAPLIVSHPFIENPFTMNERNEIVNILEDSNAFNTVIERYKDRIKEIDEYKEFLCLITKPYRLAFLKYTLPYIDKKDLSEFLIEAWVLDEYANNNANVTTNELLEWFLSADKNYLMEQSENDVFNSLPDVVTIYRGVTDYNKGNKKALSWTLSKKTAKWFATRWNENGYIFEAKINKENIIAYCNKRNEQEIIVDFNKIYELQEYPNSQLVIDNDDIDYDY